MQDEMADEQSKMNDEEMSDFWDKYKVNGRIDKSNANEVISEFEKKHDIWISFPNFNINYYADNLKLYSHAVKLSTTFDNLKKLSLFIYELEYYKCKYTYKFKFNDDCMELYHNLGVSWYNLKISPATKPDEVPMCHKNAVDAFKKSIFYFFSQCKYGFHLPVCYRFQRCSEYLYQSLSNECISISSPSCFNDPFDSPLLVLLDKSSNGLHAIYKEAYLSCIKVGCFVCNTKQQKDQSDTYEEEIRNKTKRENDVSEVQEELMWAHYADDYRGVCIKYHFKDDLTNMDTRNGTPLRYFMSVEYTDTISHLNLDKPLNQEDSFFVKSKAWEYEKELRLIQCDLNSKDNHDTIYAPNSIEAIYFGVRCPDDEVKKILRIMQNRMVVTVREKYLIGKVVKIEDRGPVKFYKMKMDLNKYGSLKAVPINPESFI